MNKALILALMAAGILSGCNKSSPPAPSSAAPASAPSSAPPPTSSQGGEVFDAQLQKLAGNGATSCGRVSGTGDVQSASDCAMQASKAKRPFYVGYTLPGMSVGIAGTADGKLYSVNYSEQVYEPTAENKAGLSGDNHLMTMPCPAALRIANSGRVTCFPPATASGASPHGGGMMGGGDTHGGGMMAAPPGTPNPHGKVPTTPGTQSPHGKLPPKSGS